MSPLIRTVHRWTSAAFIAAFLFTSFQMAQPAHPDWAPYTPLPPLFVLTLTGIYLFALPYLRRRSDPTLMALKGVVPARARPITVDEMNEASGPPA